MTKHLVTALILLGVTLTGAALTANALIKARTGPAADARDPQPAGTGESHTEPAPAKSEVTATVRSTASPLDNTGRAQNLESGDPTPEPIHGAVPVPMPHGPQLLLIPADPHKPRAEQVNWVYVPVFRVEEAKYDKGGRILRCRLDASLRADTLERVAARLREVTGTPAQTAFRVTPVRVQAVTIELEAAHKRVVLRSVQAGHDVASGPIPVLHRVTDDDVHDLLSSHLRYVSLHVHTTSPYSAFGRSMIQVESAVSAIRDAVEKVLPGGTSIDELEKHPLIVHRDAALQLQQSLREEFRVRVEGNPEKLAAFEKVLERLLSRITVSEVPLHELTSEMIDSCLVWNSKTHRLELSPNQRTTMTRALEEAREKRSAFKHAWDTMREASSKASDAEAWHNTLYEKMKLDARLKVGFAVFSGSASLNLEKEFNKSDEGSKAASREAFEKMRNAGELTQETSEKYLRKFEGDDLEKVIYGKHLRIRRLTTLNALSVKTAIIEHAQRLSKGLCERLTILPIEDNAAQQVDTLWAIGKLRSELTALKQQNHAWQRQTEAQFQQRLLDELTKVCPVGTVVPFVGDLEALPANWQLADGSPLKDPSSPLKAILKNGRVPDLNGKFIRGAVKDSELLRTGGQSEYNLSVQLPVSIKATYGNRKDNAPLCEANDPRTHQAFVTGSVALGGKHGDWADALTAGNTGLRVYKIPTLPEYSQTYYVVRIK